MATIDEALQYKCENIPDGEVNNSKSIINWKNARNISFVDGIGKKSYVIVWKEPLKDSNLKVNDSNKKTYEYGEIFNKNHMYGVYYLQYNPQNSSSRYHVDNSPSKIARNDPDWYYDHYEYGDNYAIDDYLESQGYD